MVVVTEPSLLVFVVSLLTVVDESDALPDVPEEEAPVPDELAVKDVDALALLADDEK